ncbi:hypothetical protein ON010_g12190 [Phytophthora cinnamomi]|nr:hypothetical protein ON010_g12190 [Phytophthora cinnamomi]
MAAVTISNWAATGSRTAHIVGDILMAAVETTTPKAVFVTPNTAAASKKTFRRESTMWATGKATVTAAGRVIDSSCSDSRLASAGPDGDGICYVHLGPPFWHVFLAVVWSSAIGGRSPAKSGNLHFFFAMRGQRVGASMARWLPYTNFADLRHYNGYTSSMTTVV